jgi:hypothetical protein
VFSEPQFLDDETLTSNLDDQKAQRVLNWLMQVFEKAPEDLDHALFVAREINHFYEELSDDKREDHLIKIESDCNCSFCECEVHDSDIFERIMSQLEEKYGK